MRLLAVVVGIVGVLVTAGLAWGAGEMHYENCVNAAVAAHPDPAVDPIRQRIGDTSIIDKAQAARVAAVKRCSRLP
jgi:hypothetical protein